MASSIDATKPTATVAYTADVRQNFSYAKSEIEGLQGAVAATTGTVTTGTIELGHASDTTLARVSAGVVSVEGVNVVTVSGTQTLTDKTLTSPTLTTPALGTPASGTLTSCTGLPPAGISLSATDRLVGRSTAGAGAGEEITCTAAGRSLIAASDAAAQRAILDPVPQVVNAQTGTTYTLLMADKGKLVTCSNGSAVTVTVETTTATWAAGDRVDLLNIGAGAVTISGSGVTINKAADQTAVLAQGKGASLIFISDSVAWLVGGMGVA